MANPSPNSDGGSDMPFWVKVFGVVAIALILIFVTSHLVGGGFGGHHAS